LFKQISVYKRTEHKETMLNDNKNEKWIEVVTKRDGMDYATAIRYSDITAIQMRVLGSNHPKVIDVDIHVSSDTIFTTVVTPTEANEMWNEVIGVNEE
jgi:hypothetical protein